VKINAKFTKVQATILNREVKKTFPNPQIISSLNEIQTSSMLKVQVIV